MLRKISPTINAHPIKKITNDIIIILIQSKGIRQPIYITFKTKQNNNSSFNKTLADQTQKTDSKLNKNTNILFPNHLLVHFNKPSLILFAKQFTCV